MRSTLIRGRFCLCWTTRPTWRALMSGKVAASKPSIEEAIAPMPSDKPWSCFFCAERYSGRIDSRRPRISEQKAGRFKRKCAAVADTFLLSRKEAEVLFLLAKGRNFRRHPGALYISAGTANPTCVHLPQAGRSLPARAHRSGGIHGGGLAFVDLVGFIMVWALCQMVGVSCCTARGRSRRSGR